MIPLFGAASTSQAIAPRKVGVTNEAVMSARTMRRAGMSERAASQAIGAAMIVDREPTQVATIRLVRNGASRVGSVKRRAKFSRERNPALFVKAETASQNSGSPTKIGRA